MRRHSRDGRRCRCGPHPHRADDSRARPAWRFPRRGPATARRSSRRRAWRPARRATSRSRSRRRMRRRSRRRCVRARQSPAPDVRATGPAPGRAPPGRHRHKRLTTSGSVRRHRGSHPGAVPRRRVWLPSSARRRPACLLAHSPDHSVAGRSASSATRMRAGTATGRRSVRSTQTCTNRPVAAASSSPWRKSAMS